MHLEMEGAYEAHPLLGLMGDEEIERREMVTETKLSLSCSVTPSALSERTSSQDDETPTWQVDAVVSYACFAMICLIFDRLQSLAGTRFWLATLVWCSTPCMQDKHWTTMFT